jgi:sugar lactone lactonase YvrE
MFLFLAAVIGVWSVPPEEPRPTLESLTHQARAAREVGDYPGYLRAVEGLQAMLPWSPAVRYSMARAYALNGRKAEALKVLKALAAAGWGFDAAGDTVLAPLRTEPAFAAIGASLARNAVPHGTATVVRKLPFAGQQPEGIAATTDGTLFVGALKGGISRIDADALAPVYRPAPGWGVVGLRVDAARGELIACLSDEAAGKGRVVRLALAGFREVARVDLPAAGAFCNDTAILPDGRLAVTDSTGGRLWLVDRASAAEVRIDRPLIYPNGVAFMGGTLYVAHAGGLRTVNPASGRSTDVTADGTALIGIDGLIADDGVLYAVQNGASPIRLLRIRPQAGEPATVEILASGHPALTGATTVARRGDRLLVLAQTGIPNGSLPDDPVLVAVPIGR